MLVTISALFLKVSNGFGAVVDVNKALAVADLWFAMELNSGYLKIDEITRAEKLARMKNRQVLYLVSKDNLLDHPPAKGEVLAYIVKYDPTGFVVVSGDDRLEPVIMFDVESQFSWNPSERNFLRYFLGREMVKRLEYIKKSTIDTHTNWLYLSSKLKKEKNLAQVKFDIPKNGEIYKLLITAQWHQGATLNTVVVANNGGDTRIPTGCVATGMAIKMRYHSWPLVGRGQHDYMDNEGDVRFPHNVNFSEQTYNWSNMSTGIFQTNDDAANLMYHCGVAVEMNYEPWIEGDPNSGSGAHGYDHIASMNNFFRYKGTRFWSPDDLNPLIKSIRAELPTVIRCDAHFFLADGYRNTPAPYFHINIGWADENNHPDVWYNLDQIPYDRDPTVNDYFPYCSPENYFYVDPTWTGFQKNGTLSTPYSTFSEGYAAVPEGEYLWIKAGIYSGNNIIINNPSNKIYSIRSYEGTTTFGLNLFPDLPTITVTSPNGGECWQVGSSHNITWIYTGNVGNVQIQCSYNNGTNWSTIVGSTPNDGSFLWILPNLPSASTQCLVRVREPDGEPKDTSNSVFTIAASPTITVTAPNGGESWAGGSNHNITWSSSGGEVNVKIDYSTNNGNHWASVVASTNNDGSYAWSIPTTPSTQCLVRISDAADTNNFDTSNAVFSIITGSPIRKDDLLGSWGTSGGTLLIASKNNTFSNIGVFYRNSDTGQWVRIGSAADQVVAGDLDGDGIDDLVGLWPFQGGVWIKYSETGSWERISSTADWIGAGDMNGDGRDDLLGSWSGQGVFFRDSANGQWVKMATYADQVTAGDLDGDGTDDLIGMWPSQGGVWIKYSETGSWERISSTADWIGAGDMNGDMFDDLLGSWQGQGCYYRDTSTGQWVKIATYATQVSKGDIDGDGTDDLLGTWPGQGGVWVKYSSSTTWERLSSTADWIAAGKMRGTGASGAMALSAPIGGIAEGPNRIGEYEDLSDEGPGGWNFAYQEEENLIPREDESMSMKRVPGPGEPGFQCIDLENLVPREGLKIKRDRKRN